MKNLYLVSKQNFKKVISKKKIGDDKLVVSLVLIAIGVVCCLIYRDTIKDVLESTLKTLGEKITATFNIHP